MDSFNSDDDDDLLAAVMELDSGIATIPAKAVNYISNNCRGVVTDFTAENVDSELSIPVSFPFPFTPYDIQQDFMSSLYTCLELGKVGIFESPTGTGKSMSLICGAVKWLRDFQDKKRQALVAIMEKSSTENLNQGSSSEQVEELDWIHQFAAKKEQEEKLTKLKNEQLHIEKREAKLKELQRIEPSARRHKRKLKEDLNFNDLMSGASEDIRQAFIEEMRTLDRDMNDQDETYKDDQDLLVEDYKSDDENENRKGDNEDQDENEEEHVTKIYYCSRTHSQLSQFVREIIKSPFDNVRVISLGSRQTMCINPSVRNLSSQTLINDRCLELQQKKSKKKPGCPFHKQQLLDTLKDKALLEVTDIEQLVATGREMKACPYYAARYAIPLAEIVALPYNTLLHKHTRAACGIKLAGNVVIIDEAHNLLETINNIHSMEITASQIVKSHSQLSQYEKKFKARLKAKNLLYVRQILFVLSQLAGIMRGSVNYDVDTPKDGKEEICLLTINDFLFRSHLDNFNMFKLLRYCKQSQISQKLHGFVEKYQESEVKTGSIPDPQVSGLTKFLQEIQATKHKSAAHKLKSEEQVSTDQTKTGYMSSPLMQIESFLDALTTADQDGRVVINKQVMISHSSLKFLMLNPGVHFASVLHEARAVIVAGGTMQPVSEFKNQLFRAAGVSPSRVIEFSCGHVIPGHQILPMAVAKGPTGVTLDFTYQNRDKLHMIEELGRSLCNVCNVVPGGVVCFFPSYEYERMVYSSWEKNGVLQKLQLKKRIFREPKNSQLAENVLSEYSACIKRCATWQGSLTGAVLMSVVGGKMSEGINFSDDLGRCVVMVGLPYPNINSPELKEKMSYLNCHFPPGPDGRLAGQIHYENLCMKAVNQSIGRAIRHKDDYASILLLDQRFFRPRVTSMLPEWISKHMQPVDKFATVMQALPKFFRGCKSKS